MFLLLIRISVIDQENYSACVMISGHIMYNHVLTAYLNMEPIISRTKTERVRHGYDMWRSSFLSSFMDSLCRVRKKKCMYSRNELFMRSPECYFGVYFPSCFADREINTKITLSWALKKFVTRVHTLFAISPWWGLQSDKFNNNDFKAIFIHSKNFQAADV